MAGPETFIAFTAYSLGSTTLVTSSDEFFAPMSLRDICRFTGRVAGALMLPLVLQTAVVGFAAPALRSHSYPIESAILLSGLPFVVCEFTWWAAPRGAVYVLLMPYGLGAWTLFVLSGWLPNAFGQLGIVI